MKLAVGSKQPLYGAGLKPALGRIAQERAGMKPAPTAAPCYDFGRYDNSETVSDAGPTQSSALCVLCELYGLAGIDRQDETVSEFSTNPKSFRDINAETEPTRCRMVVQLAVDSKQPLYGAGLKPALGWISKERAGLKPAPTAASCYDFGR